MRKSSVSLLSSAPARKVGVWILLSLLTTVAWAQSERVVLPRAQLRVEEVIRAVQQQTDYTFAFDARVFDVSRTVQIASIDQPVEALLKLITAGTGYTWLRKDSYLVIHRAAPRRAPQPVRESRTGDVYTPSTGEEAFSARERQPVVISEPPPPVREPVRPKPAEVYPPPFSLWRDPDIYAPISHSLPRGAVKTNLLYGLATMTPNLGVEWAIDARSSVEFTGSWNQINHEGRKNDNRKLNHGIARLEYRRWFCERYNGHFVGANLFTAKYNIGGYDLFSLFEKEFRYEGRAFGVGLTYGYHLALARRWGVELHAGVGVAQFNSTRFECPRCGSEIDRPSKTWFGPTRVGVSVVYLIR